MHEVRRFSNIIAGNRQRNEFKVLLLMVAVRM
jgi:hypothetical protein